MKLFILLMVGVQCLSSISVVQGVKISSMIEEEAGDYEEVRGRFLQSINVDFAIDTDDESVTNLSTRLFYGLKTDMANIITFLNLTTQDHWIVFEGFLSQLKSSNIRNHVNILLRKTSSVFNQKARAYLQDYENFLWKEAQEKTPN